MFGRFVRDARYAALEATSVAAGLGSSSVEAEHLLIAIASGNSKAAHAGERIFDVDAPGFRAATAFGAIGGAVVALLLVAASMRLSRRRRQVKDLKGRLSERERADREREEAEREEG